MSDRAPEHLRVALVDELALTLANRVIEACAARGVVLMPLKGVLLLARWPALRGRRDLVDVDFLVRPSDLETVTSVLRSLGFEPTVRSSAGATFASDAWPLAIDVHAFLFPHGLFGLSTESVFSRASLDDGLFAAPVARMSDEDLFAHLVGHFVKGRGTFRRDTSLDDLRWLQQRDCLSVRDAHAVAARLRQSGLRRAAGYVLGHHSVREEPVASAVLDALRLSWVDHLTIVLARVGADTHDGSPRWWTPHLLDRSLPAGLRSLVTHAAEAGHRGIRGVTSRWGSTWRASSASRVTRRPLD